MTEQEVQQWAEKHGGVFLPETLDCGYHSIVWAADRRHPDSKAAAVYSKAGLPEALPELVRCAERAIADGTLLLKERVAA